MAFDSFMCAEFHVETLIIYKHGFSQSYYFDFNITKQERSV